MNKGDQMDNELYILCDVVYKLTGWASNLNNTPEMLAFGKNGKFLQIVNKGEFNLGDFDHFTPFYTTDFLLTKIPLAIGNYGLEMWSYPDGKGVAFGYYDVLERKWNMDVPQRGDRVPLIALLKLTIALYDAHELK